MPTVTILPQGWQFAAGPDTTLLAAAELAGIRLLSSCRNGTCRTCLCHMSRANFARVFRQVAGTTPAALLQQLRLAQAAQWLRQDSRPVAAIGEQAGYQSEAAFNRVFKRAFGIGPGQYRRMAAVKGGAPPAPAA